MTNTIFGMITFQFEHQGFMCEAEVFVQPPEPAAESDWDVLGYKYVNDIYVDAEGVYANDIGLDEATVWRHYEIWEETQELELERGY